jgi:hypothetical protein
VSPGLRAGCTTGLTGIRRMRSKYRVRSQPFATSATFCAGLHASHVAAGPEPMSATKYATDLSYEVARLRYRAFANRRIRNWARTETMRRLVDRDQRCVSTSVLLRASQAEPACRLWIPTEGGADCVITQPDCYIAPAVRTTSTLSPPSTMA